MSCCLGSAAVVSGQQRQMDLKAQVENPMWFSVVWNAHFGFASSWEQQIQWLILRGVVLLFGTGFWYLYVVCNTNCVLVCSSSLGCKALGTGKYKFTRKWWKGGHQKARAAGGGCGCTNRQKHSSCESRAGVGLCWHKKAFFSTYTGVVQLMQLPLMELGLFVGRKWARRVSVC